MGEASHTEISAKCLSLLPREAGFFYRSLAGTPHVVGDHTFLTLV
jgi:hypothetical protein